MLWVSRIYSQNGGKSQKDFVRNKFFELRSRFPVMIHEGPKQIETKTTYFFRLSTMLLCFMETRLIQQGRGSISSVMETPKEVCFSISHSNWESSEENSNGRGPNLAENSSLLGSALVSMSPSNVGEELNFDTP